MAGHSKYANTKHRKAAQDSKKSKNCTKLRREVIVAAKAGLPDPELNNRLKLAISKARKEGLSSDRIEAALKTARGETEGENYEELSYEGYAADGVAVIIHSLTDNKNRTASELRYIFSRKGGALGESGSVKFLFDNVGMVVYENTELFSDLLDIAIEVGAQDIKEEDDKIYIYSEKNDLARMRDELQEKFGNPTEARLSWVPLNYLEFDDEKKEKIHNLIDELNDSDDVQYVETNVNW